MKKILLLTMASLTFFACDRPEKERSVEEHTVEVREDADNTAKNVIDRDSRTLTPLDQSESTEDRTITQKIRQALIADSALSVNAKNIKVITVKGVVTLRGPVANAQEKEMIARKIANVPGVKRVDNNLEITRNP